MLEAIDLDAIDAAGYVFQIETTFRALRKGFRVVEIPIRFADRTAGAVEDEPRRSCSRRSGRCRCCGSRRCSGGCRSGMRELDEATFDDAIAGRTPLLVDFWAPWCRPCKALEPILDELPVEAVARVNIDEEPGSRRATRSSRSRP